MQYRVGETGLFTNLPDGFIADVTDGPTIAGRKTSRLVALPSNCFNQPKVQVRLITTNAAGSDEWIGVNNIVVTSLAPTAASVGVSGRVLTETGSPISRAIVEMTDSSGVTRSAISNSFGYYHFESVLSGELYVFNVRSKRYTFSNQGQVLYLLEDTDSLNFIGTE
jgi:hypothetical protein